MPQEITLEDFSGGMDSSVAIDKMDTKECLLAESVRFDEAGNVLISGANTAQNTAAISDGTSSNVHSLFYDSSIGCIAGVGTDIWIGPSPAALSDFSSINSGSAKMSFGAAPGRIYMDIGGVGYFKDVTLGSLLTVDWGPPDSAGATTTTKNAGTGIASGSGASWANPNNITSTNSFSLTTSALSTATPFSNMLLATNFGFSISATAIVGFTVSITAKSTTPAQLQVYLVRGGIPVGLVHVVPLTASLATYTFGASTDLWGISNWVQGDVNASNFGFQIRTVGGGSYPSTVSMYQGQITVYQGAGMVAAGGTTGTLTGNYSWKITFAGPNGEESQASTPTGTIALTSQQGTLTAIPTGDVRTTARKIYRRGNLLSNYYLVGSLSDNVSTTYSDNQADIAALAEAVILAGDVIGDEPNTRLGNQSVKYPTLHYERVFWANGNILIWSKPLNGFAYPADFSTPVGDSKVITGIVSQGGELIVFKSDSIWRLTGTDENSFQLSRTLSPVGTDWPFSIAFAGGSTSGFYFTGRIIFANRLGIWAFNGYSSNKISAKLDLWFRQDDRTGTAVQGVNGFRPPEISNSTVTAGFQAAASASFYRLAYAESGQSANNAMLVLDLERGQISKRSFAAPSMAVDPVSNYFYAGSTSGKIVQLDDWNATGNGLGGAINFDFQTKYYDLKLRGSKFAVWGIEFLVNTGGQTVTPYVYFDEGTGTAETLGTISVTQPSRVFRKLAGANSRSCRNFSIRLNCSTSNANASGKPNVQLNHLKIYYEERQGRARTGE